MYYSIFYTFVKLKLPLTMKKRKLLFLTLCLMVFVCPSCKKQSDTFGPQITFSKPSENQMFNMYDYIPVVANVCDDHKLSSIDISVTDESFITVIHAPVIYPENNCFDINTSMQILDIHIPTGYYYVLIRASDGINETRKFQKIYITSLPKKLKYLIVVTKNASEIKISKIDSTFTLSPIKTLTTDYCGTAVSSDAQLFYIAGRYTGDVSVFSTIDWQLQWNIHVIVSPPFPYFEAIAVENSMLYVSYRSGKFEVYNDVGSIRAQRVVDNGNYPTVFTPLNNKLMTYERSPSDVTRQMVTYFTPSYTIQQKVILTCEIQNIYKKDEDNCLVFCNYTNTAAIKLYTISTHNFWDAYTETSGKIVSTVRIDANSFLYISNNIVHWYNYQNSSSVAMASGQNLQHLVFDETTSNYYFSENYYTVKKYVLPSTTQQASLTIPDSIINLIPVYNKD